jgi:hypothetical protein
MSRATRPLAATLPLLLALSCAERAALEPPPDLLASTTAEEARDYLRFVSSRLARRPLVREELERVEAEGPAAITPIVAEWVRDPAFVLAARDMLEHLLKTSGRLDDVDYDLPGNLAAHLARSDLPYSGLLTAQACYDREGAELACDTEAPYKAGVLTTRAYLAASSSRFNLRRATTLMRVFACRTYPMDQQLQPPIEKMELIPMFRASTPEEQVVEEAQNGFGNGFGCYTCHSQFAAHAQLFVKFDSSGLWRSFAHGLQNEHGELGRSIGRFYASHFVRPVRSEDETGMVFGREVANLAQAARVIVADEGFVPCAVRRAFEYAFDLDETTSALTDPSVYSTIADSLRAAGHEDPTFAQLFTAVLASPVVIRAVIDQRRGS